MHVCLCVDRVRLPLGHSASVAPRKKGGKADKQAKRHPFPPNKQTNKKTPTKNPKKTGGEGGKRKTKCEA